MNSRVSQAVAAILSAQAAHASADAGPTDEAAATQPGRLSEVIVTAQRRAEHIQGPREPPRILDPPGRCLGGVVGAQ